MDIRFEIKFSEREKKEYVQTSVADYEEFINFIHILCLSSGFDPDGISHLWRESIELEQKEIENKS
jgi:hypothetical protein